MSTPAQRTAQRIDDFLKDEAIDGVLSRMERRYYEEFITADTEEKRVRAWAKAKMLRDFETEMKVITDAGEYDNQLHKLAARDGIKKPQ